jgi:catechol 2,3-dioxygenase-like lactoylglutathione lyase family enzyme
MNFPDDSVVRPGGLEGVVWVLQPTFNFDATVACFDAFEGLVLEGSGVPVEDLQFSKYAVFRSQTGVVLEVVEPTVEKAEVFTHPVVSISVRDLPATRKSLTEQGLRFTSDVLGDEGGESWTYFRGPGGTLYQLSADSSAEQAQPVERGALGIARIVIPCRSVAETIDFFERNLGLAVDSDSVGPAPSRFRRSAEVRMKNGVVLELVEPLPSMEDLYRGPVAVLTVKDLPSEIASLEERGLPLPVVNDNECGEGGWCCFRVPGGTTFELRSPSFSCSSR